MEQSQKYDLAGQRFGRLTVLHPAQKLFPKSGRTRRIWHCVCDCGTRKELLTEALVQGMSRSCGCWKVEVIRATKTTHGHSRKGAHSKTYRAWANMFVRCKQDKKYYSHVSVCERWKKFENFLEDMGEKPDGKSVDRIDGMGNYEPGNVRWATAAVQTANRRPHGSVA